MSVVDFLFRRERNRLHAKLTRDRKKLFTNRMQQLIQTLERHNMTLRGRLSNLLQGVEIVGSNSLIPGSSASDIVHNVLNEDGQAHF